MKTVFPLLSRAAEQYAEKIALISPDKNLTFAELARICSILQAKFRITGIEPGQRVAVLSPNSLRLFILIHALIEYGATVAPLSTRYPQVQLKKALQRLIPHHFLVETQFSHLPATGSGTQPLQQLFDFSRVKAQNLLPQNDLSYDCPATMLFTSGSTSQPKIAVHNYENHFYSALGSRRNIKVGKNDRWLLSLPMYHVGGLAIGLRTFLAGAATVIPEQKDDLLQSMIKNEITHVSLVATQLQRLLEKKNAIAVLKKCKAILLGGSAIPHTILQKAIQAGLPLHTSYGSTEMSSQIATTRPMASSAELKTAGKVLLWRNVKISRDGEVLVSGKTRFCGYFGNGEIRRPFDSDGYFHTGDLGYFDAAKNLIISGRKDNLIISGGENIQPEEIEGALAEITGVAQAVVVAVASDKFGQRPVAFVKFSGECITGETLRLLLGKKIARFKIPDQFYDWPAAALPEGIKIQRQFFAARAKELNIG